MRERNYLGFWDREVKVDARYRSTNSNLKRYFGAAECEVTPPNPFPAPCTGWGPFPRGQLSIARR